MQYPATLTPAEEGGFVVTFRDIPEAITQGETEDEALCMAADVLLSSMDFYFDDKRRVPLPSKPKKDEVLVALPPSVAAKVLLLNEMLTQNVRPIDLAGKINTSKQSVNRLLDLNHPTKIDAIGVALEALGKHLELRVA